MTNKIGGTSRLHPGPVKGKVGWSGVLGQDPDKVGGCVNRSVATVEALGFEMLILCDSKNQGE